VSSASPRRAPPRFRIVRILAVGLGLLAGGATAAQAAGEGEGEAEADPFRPPPGQAEVTSPPPAPRRLVQGFVQPSLGAGFRLTRNRDTLPAEGFGFGLEIGLELGRDQQRLRFAVSYGFARMARSVEFTPESTEITRCTEVRSATYHLVTGMAGGSFDAGPVVLYAALAGGMAYAQVRDPNPTCTTDETNAVAGTLGTEAGLGYRLRSNVLIGLRFAYLHVFSHRQYEDYAAVRHRLFYDLIALDLSLLLRF
jgi:hypothetical protein